VALIAHRKFGGMTGDVLGAVVQVSQMAALVAVSRLLDDFDWFSIGWFWN